MEIRSTASNAYASQLAQGERTQQSRQLESKEPRAQEQVEKKEEPPKPVANAEGHKTGQVINVTA